MMQSNENHQQRGLEKFLDTVLSITGKSYSDCKSVLMGFYTLSLSKRRLLFGTANINFR